jgi:AhpD family alkylhydroperoxidase
MSKRINLAKVAPEAYDAMLGLEKYLANTGIDHKLYELIKTRASQINGCAFCLNMHTRDAIKIGETPQRLFLLNAWRETELFSEKERAALALTEALTLVSVDQVPDDVYDHAASLFSEKELADIIIAIVAINGWNRIAISTHKPLD